MIKNNIVFLVTIILVFSGCVSNTERVVESKYPDSSPQVVKYYKNSGQQRELVREEGFYQNKQKRLDGEYKNNQRDGRWVYYYESGKVWSEGFFKNGKSEGQRITYFENGFKRYEGQYKNDLRIGIWRFYDETGLLVNQIDYGAGQAVTEEE